MKKILFITLSIILIPLLIITLFKADMDVKFEFVSTMVVRVKRESTDIIEEVPFEEYITGVLAGEMPVSFHLEALKAQAVAARTYVMLRMVQNKEQEYDIVDTVSHQVYLNEEQLRAKWQANYDNYIAKIKTAILETKGTYMTYDGEIIDATFFSTSVGQTENSEEVFSSAVPYLRSVESKWDEEVSPVFSDQFEYALDEFFDRLGLTNTGTVEVSILKTTSTGRIKAISINNQTFTGNEVQEKLAIRSTYFTITQNKNQVIIDTKGYGHGVGMSQYGANGMASEGYTYDKILMHYYQGIEFQKF